MPCGSSGIGISRQEDAWQTSCLQTGGVLASMHGQAANPLHGSVLFGESKDRTLNRLFPALSWKY